MDKIKEEQETNHEEEETCLTKLKNEYKELKPSKETEAVRRK